ncbi:hypothetical protein GCM10027452_29340 [Micromonospora halotolerans]
MRSRSAAFPLFAVVSWGVMFPVLASALTRVDALNLTTARYLLASVVLRWRCSGCSASPASTC